MKTFRELFWGIGASLLSLLILFGALSIAFFEENSSPSPQPSPTATFSFAEVFPTLTIFVPSPTATASPSRTATQTATQPATNTPEPLPTQTASLNACTPPEGWEAIPMDSDFVLEMIGEVSDVSLGDLLDATCLDDTNTSGLDTIYVYAPSPTPSVYECGPPAGWKTYRVKSGDNLFRIGLAYDLTVPEIQFANCLGNSTLIITGQILYVPNVSPRKTSPKPTKTRKAKKHHRSNTPVPTRQNTNTPIPSNTLVPPTVPPTPIVSLTTPPPTNTSTPTP